MTGIFVREMRGMSIYKDIEEMGEEGHMKMEVWGDASSNQGVLRITNKHQKQGER